MIRKCPVCRMVPLIRPDIRTCSRECSKEWATWSPESKVRMLEMASLTPQQQLEQLKPITKREVLENNITGHLQPEDDSSDEAADHILKILGGPDDLDK